ncbi:helix-turn-helix domain-containing protein [Xylella fastidiosa]|uniref:helix-turn-helix domain-containing protein n=1 Tax=Xylella fastidiosa TaxID=2371 RepID=UPI001F38FB86|nr:helix-turn-helix transcriptional regulator [Xylella fastidiosa]WNY19311.1 helix-turn-helix transcriptional regulator [Xylella fastidiosa]WNY21601.1 helix-turn-helix transcriptional regulator [Xylella fastidiosa]
MTYHIDFPAILRATRAALNLTQKQLAKRLGVSFTTVNRWESGGNTPQHAAHANHPCSSAGSGGPRDRKPPASRSRRTSDAAAHAARGDGHAHNQTDGADAVGCRLLDPRREGRS